MKGREAKGAPAADLLVCFPSRAHLSLMPKPICSPARSSEPNKRHHHHLHHLKKSSTRGSAGQASPLLWAKTKPMGSDLVSEPTSPKVTCAGQIKVRHKTSACKSWQSVMEEIERMHNGRKQRKKPHWAEALGFKKEVMQFLTCLRNIRFDFRCFGSFPHRNDVTTDDDDDDDEDLEEEEECRSKETTAEAEGSRTVFSKWFMVLQEEQSHDSKRDQRVSGGSVHEEGISGGGPAVPPPNALLLMRCRSAPAKSWLEEREEEEEKEDEDKVEDEEEREAEEERTSKRSLKCLMEDEKKKKKMEESVVVMRYDPDLYKISSDIAKETWVVGGIRDPLSRSRSWKR